jgi:hypothetical protein
MMPSCLDIVCRDVLAASEGADRRLRCGELLSSARRRAQHCDGQVSVPAR